MVVSADELAPETLAEFEQIYALFDANGDGYLTRQEISEALEVLGHGIAPSDRDQLFRLFKNDVLSHSDFIAWMAQRQDLDVSRDLRQVFDLIDVDKSGHLSFEEFRQIIRCFESASDQEIEALIREADLDGDGQIDFQEFITTQAKHSELQIPIAVLRSFKKILMEYAKVAEVSSISLIEVDSDLGAGKRGASKGTDLLKQIAIEKQTALMRADNGIISLESRAVQNENHVLAQSQRYPYAKHIDAIYTVLERTTNLVAETLENGLFPLVLGGDHSTAAGTIAGISKAFPDRRLGVVWIDAHADIHSPYTTPSGNMHGMPLGIATAHDNLEHQLNEVDRPTQTLWDRCKALGAGDRPNLNFQDLIYVSVRDTEEAEDDTIAQYQIPIITTSELRHIGPEAAAQRCLTYLADCDIIYVSFDVDSMDSSICMGTGTPVPGGLWAEEAQRLNVALLRDPRVCCWEICEINPLLDTLNTMAENSLSIFEAVVDALADRLRDSRANPQRTPDLAQV